MIMAVAPHVDSYTEQPETFSFEVDGRLRSYTPDGLAQTSFGPIYFEVKPLKKLAESPDLEGRLDQIKVECAARGARFSIVTEADVRVGSLLGNSIAAWSAAQGLDHEDLHETLALLRGVKFPVTAKDLSLLGAQRWRRTKALIGMRYLAADLALPLSEDTIIVRGRRYWCV